APPSPRPTPTPSTPPAPCSPQCRAAPAPIDSRHACASPSPFPGHYLAGPGPAQRSPGRPAERGRRPSVVGAQPVGADAGAELVDDLAPKTLLQLVSDLPHPLLGDPKPRAQ